MYNKVASNQYNNLPMYLYESLLDDVEVDEVEDNDNFESGFHIVFAIEAQINLKSNQKVVKTIDYYFNVLKIRGIVCNYEIIQNGERSIDIDFNVNDTMIDIKLFNVILFYVSYIIFTYGSFMLSVVEFGNDENISNQLIIDMYNNSCPLIIHGTDSYMEMFPDYNERDVLESVVYFASKYNFILCVDEEAKIYQMRINRTELGNDYVKKIIVKHNGIVLYETIDTMQRDMRQFDMFHNGLVSVYSPENKSWFVMNREGRFISSTGSAERVCFYHELAVVNFGNDEGYGLMNMKGEIVTTEKYKSITQTSEGISIVTRKEGICRVNCIDTEGKIMFDEWFKKIEGFNKYGYAKVLNDNGYGVVDVNGKLLFRKKSFESIENIADGLWVVRDNAKDNKQKELDPYYLVNNKGRKISEVNFVTHGDFKNGFISICVSNFGWNYLDEEGNLLCKNADGTPEWYSDCGNFDEGGNAVVIKKNKYNIINSFGKVISKEWFNKWLNMDADDVRFIEGFAKIKVDGLYKFIDRHGKWLSDESFIDVVQYFKNGYAVVRVAGNYCNIINKYGKLILDSKETKYTSMGSFVNGIAKVSRGSVEDLEWNYIRTNGSVVSKEWFRNAAEFVGNAACVENKQNLYNYMDRSGRFLLDKWLERSNIESQIVSRCTILNKVEDNLWNMITSEGQLLLDEWTGIRIRFYNEDDQLFFTINDNICVDETGKYISFI